MYISMPRDFFVPVMYDYKENLNLIDEENQEMYRESKGNINAEYQKALQEKEAIYVKPRSKETTGEEDVNEKYYEELKAKDATYVKQNMYEAIDDEYIKEATVLENKPGNISCNKGETKENYNVSINRRMYSDLDDEYARGFKR